MWNRTMLRGAAAALSMMAVFAHAADKSDKGGQGQLAKGDRNFIMEAAQGGMMEVQLGKIAQQNGQSDAVKQLGKRLEDDHAKANQELTSIAQKLGVTPPAQLDKKHQSKVDKMSKAKAQDFDREFAKLAVDDHKKDIKDFRKQADKGKNADLKQFASSALPTLEEHLKLAQDAQASAKGAAKGGAKTTEKGTK